MEDWNLLFWGFALLVCVFFFVGFFSIQDKEKKAGSPDDTAEEKEKPLRLAATSSNTHETHVYIHLNLLSINPLNRSVTLQNY